LSVYSYFLPDHPELLGDPEAGPLPPPQARELGDRLVGLGTQLPNPSVLSNRWLLGSVVLLRHESAKRALIAAGRPRDKVEAMPHLQVAVLHSLLEYDAALDEFARQLAQPYWEAAPALKEAERKARLRRAN